MIRASKNSSLYPRRSKLPRSIAHQRETGKDFGLKPVTASSTRQRHLSQLDPIANVSINSVAVAAAAAAAVLVLVLVLVLALAEAYIVSFTRCE